MLRVTVLRINCAPIWLYLQDYTWMDGKQNIKKNEYSRPYLLR